MARDHALRSDELGGDRGLSRAHREMVPDRQHRDLGGIDAPDQRHVAEDVRVAREVDRREIGCFDDEAAGLPGVGALVRRGVVGMRERDVRPEQVDAAPLVDRLRHVRADLLAEKPSELDLGDHGAGERAGQADGVTDVVGMPVRKEDRVEAIRLELGDGAGRVSCQERVDIDPGPGGKVEAERRVSEPGDRWSHPWQVMRRARGRPCRPGRSAAARRRTSRS